MNANTNDIAGLITQARANAIRASVKLMTEVVLPNPEYVEAALAVLKDADACLRQANDLLVKASQPRPINPEIQKDNESQKQ